MSYKDIVQAAIKKANSTELSRVINESILYPEGLKERMHPKLEDDLKNQKHSLGKHPAFPDGDESTFEEKILGNRFNDVCKRYKRIYEVDSIDNDSVKNNMIPLVMGTMQIEGKHRKALEKLAIRMIREEYDMSEDAVEIHAELTEHINMEGTNKNDGPNINDIEFDNHDDIKNANDEVYKRRFLNAMTQGAAKKCNQMFHMVDDELTELDPKLPARYSKMMASADYMYYVIPKMEKGINGGVVRVEFPNKNNPKAVIRVQAMVFPVLIHELVKGVMELLSAHGLPKNKKIAKYTIDKADFLAAEPWDMRLGPALWERFTNLIEPDDFHLKHQIYAELAALPVNEFNYSMKEIMANTKKGKKIILDIVDNIKREIQEDEFNEAMGDEDEENDEGFDWDDAKILF